MERTIYLDNAAATQPSQEVLQIYNETNKKHYANPSSLHKMGLQGAAVINSDIKMTIAQKINCFTD